MKNVLYIGLILLTLGITGCEEQLEVLPENSLTLNNALTTPQDFESAIWGIEQILRTSGISNGPLIQELKGYYVDIIPSNGSSSLKNNYNSVEIVSYNTQNWQIYYQGIAATNTVLNRVDDAPLSKDRQNLYKGQALFFKATFYYKIIQRWGDCMLVKDDVLLQPQAKTPWHEVVAYAIELTREAVRLLPEFNQMTDWKGNTYANKAIPGKGAANALLAYLCAWQAGCKYFANNPDYDEQQLWKEAEQACTEIIESKAYELEPNPESVCTRGLVENSSESIYETVNRGFEYELSTWDMPTLVHLLAYDCDLQTWYPESSSDISSINSSYRNKILVSTVNKWYGTGDTRKDAYFYRVNEFEEQTGGYAWCYKYREAIYNKNDGLKQGLNQNKVWWRLADIYLLRAECRARLGGEYTAGAIDDLNKIRDRAGAKRYESTEDGGDLRYTIFLERQKELFLEGHRYFDVIRNGYVNTELHGNFKTLSVQDMKDGALFMCIGSSAFDNNPLLRQNTYWFRRM